MLGEGPIYEQMGREGGDLFTQAVPEIQDEAFEESPDSELADSTPVQPSIVQESDNQGIREELPSGSRKVVQVMLFFDDDTFVTYKPSQ